MYYNSINNKLNIKNFINIFLKNIPKDKSLYFPFIIKKFNKIYINSLKKLNYLNFSFNIINKFINCISEEEIFLLLKNSYNKFYDKNIINFYNLENNSYLLNLNNGPTLTFKDIALQPLGIFLNFISKIINKKIIIFCATSGDTGSSAINSFKNYENIKLIIFHPFNMISNIQRKQMTTIIRKNIFNISILGNFDFTQYIIKNIFENIKKHKNYLFISVNSINWFRIILQTVYYCYSSLKLYTNKLINYYIPSGNFGNATSAFIAKKLGFPIGKIIVCNNDNNYLDNFFKKSLLLNKKLKSTISPAIDISIPSNFKRIFNKKKIKKKYINFYNNFFYSDTILNKTIINSIEYFFNIYKKIYDPHTITSITSFFNNNINNNNNIKFIVSTSYPIKFFYSIKKIIPNIKINLNIKNIFLLKEKYKIFNQNFKIIINYIKKII
ncbi:threonine synthase [Candidatus Carsonella ruddii CS isolate Thao2000]|uniref:Threonine synthase n=1 Tax=Candidatus Carsonella ruddii CS isolate Thao2000 TaxID=1202537 RepID=J7GYV8_CARRU|nr:threonine synthase [Candidatus Carsonella ruddii]AFP83793.1 threonine synthase [Candidatus Carsonella ruddii CS isolate Thao2000]